MSDLAALGWGPDVERDYQAFRQTLTAQEQARVQPVRIVGTGRQAFRVRGEQGEGEARLAGTLRQAQVTPAIGDWCVVQAAPTGPGRLLHVLPRRTTFSRALGTEGGRRRPQAVRQQALAANVDVVLIVTAPDADFDLARLERYVRAVQASGARPVLVLNKADLSADVDGYLHELRRLGPDLELQAVSAAGGQGLAGLRALLTGGGHAGPDRVVGRGQIDPDQCLAQPGRGADR